MRPLGHSMTVTLPSAAAVATRSPRGAKVMCCTRSPGRRFISALRVAAVRAERAASVSAALYASTASSIDASTSRAGLSRDGAARATDCAANCRESASPAWRCDSRACDPREDPARADEQQQNGQCCG